MGSNSDSAVTSAKFMKIASQHYKLQMTDHILDTVYGHIGITQVEKELERCSIFKRLHNISQLGLVNWIFPCAVHTRYVHSIGVMHMAYEMGVHININCTNNGDAEPFFTDDDLQIIRLTGMLHDIGHYPLSHNVEAAYKEGLEEKQNERKTVLECQKELVGCPDYLATTGSEFFKDIDPETIAKRESDKYLEDFSGSKGYHHEKIGADIIVHNKELRDIIRDNFVTMKEGDDVCLNPFFASESGDGSEDPNQITERLMRMIAEMVTGNYEYCAASIASTEESNGARRGLYLFEAKYSAMIQLIHSEMDADNLDYLLRDATFSGTSYGLMDVGVLLNSLTVSKINMKDDAGEGDATRYLIGVLPKGIGCVEQFLTNKYMAYSQMIFSKYTSALEAMLLNWAKHRLPNDETYGIEGEESDKSGEKTGFLALAMSEKTQPDYLNFTDAFVFQRIHDSYKKMLELKKSGEVDLNEVRFAMVSRLVNYSSLDLAENAECKCVGFGEEDLQNQMRGESLYQEYQQLIKKIGTYMTLKEFYDTHKEYGEKNIEKQLLAFRFENYSMTKQVPIKQFCERFASPDCDQLVKRHYFRLANGIPILPKTKKNTFEIVVDDEGKIDLEKLPNLIVDSQASSLHKTWDQKFVYLRKYNLTAF